MQPEDFKTVVSEKLKRLVAAAQVGQLYRLAVMIAAYQQGGSLALSKAARDAVLSGHFQLTDDSTEDGGFVFHLVADDEPVGPDQEEC